MRLLVIEDNPKTAGFICQGLSEQGYIVDVAPTGSEGERAAVTESYDLVILDIMLPDQDGIQVCRNLRRQGVKAPILMLTALSSTADKVTGLDAGADDYLVKPFLGRKVSRAGQRMNLTAKEFALLEYFLRNPNRVLTRTAIGERVWDMNFESDSNVIDVYVSMLRRKIDKGFDARLIHTVIGAGYVLSAEAPNG